MSRSAVLWAIAGVACVPAAGCDFVFRIDRLPTTQDAADLRPHEDAFDAQPITCTSPVINTELDNPMPCLAWGMAYADLGATITGGPSGITISPQNQLNSIAGCYSINNQPFGIAGVKAHVTDVLDGADTYTVLQIHGPDLQVRATGHGTVVFGTTSEVVIGAPVLVQPPMWFRMRPIGTTTIIGEVSPDDTIWTELGTATLTVPATVGVELNAGVNGGLTGGKGVFDRLVVCP